MQPQGLRRHGAAHFDRALTSRWESSWPCPFDELIERRSSERRRDEEALEMIASNIDGCGQLRIGFDVLGDHHETELVTCRDDAREESMDRCAVEFGDDCHVDLNIVQ